MNLDVMDSTGPGKLVRHMQNPSYTNDTYLIYMGLGPSILSVIDKSPSYSGPSYPSSPVPPRKTSAYGILMHHHRSKSDPPLLFPFSLPPSCLKYSLVDLFGSEGSALTLPLFLLSPRIIMLCHCSSTITKDHFLMMCYGTK